MKGSCTGEDSIIALRRSNLSPDCSSSSSSSVIITIIINNNNLQHPHIIHRVLTHMYTIPPTKDVHIVPHCCLSMCHSRWRNSSSSTSASTTRNCGGYPLPRFTTFFCTVCIITAFLLRCILLCQPQRLRGIINRCTSNVLTTVEN